ncbi:MAG: glycoside hydrolase family 3 C-terminal domain-containing protein, partial [Bacteroidetes bacterium]|nr:glycoside hydrolase family 3 C-terminal domain-containing protein [Bacteroidota bacterium]
GINWTFAPMLDIGRDPRWGRVAETLGEDPLLSGILGAAMVRGFQGASLSDAGSIAACAKHFAGYGASEAGRDYNTTSIPEGDLRNIHLPPFRAALDAGAATVMTSFSDLNGVPATANTFLLERVLRQEWKFDGFVVSDWESVPQLAVHGLTAGDRESAFEAASAGCDMEMASGTYAAHLATLVTEGAIPMDRIDAMVANILRVKLRLGLFDRPSSDSDEFPTPASPEHLDAARTAARQSIVLLKNENSLLPLTAGALRSLAVIGPLADDPYEQLGTWIFDGDPQHSRTPLQAITDTVGDDVHIRHVRAMATTRSRSREGFAEAVRVAEESDVAILFLGEESILSGEAHCRADIRLPGSQEDLIRAVAATGTPVVLVCMAGRPLALGDIIEHVDALLFAWHPGSMGGPAIADLLFGAASPSGKLPVTFPRMTGQIPIYYSRKNTGKPATPESVMHIDDIPPRAPQVSFGLTSFHLDAGASPLFPFGYGLSYATFRYDHIRCSAGEIPLGGSVTISAEVSNEGSVEADEVVQLYVRDLVGSVTRPVRELKGFQRVRLQPGASMTVSFTLHTDDLAFHGRDMRFAAEPGDFHAWIGGSSDAELRTEFTVTAQA